MFTKVTFFISDEDQLNIERVKERHPGWSAAVIFRRALAKYANSLVKSTPQPPAPSDPLSRNIEELYGPQV